MCCWDEKMGARNKSFREIYKDPLGKLLFFFRRVVFFLCLLSVNKKKEHLLQWQGDILMTVANDMCFGSQHKPHYCNHTIPWRTPRNFHISFFSICFDQHLNFIDCFRFSVYSTSLSERRSEQKFTYCVILVFVWSGMTRQRRNSVKLRKDLCKERIHYIHGIYYETFSPSGSFCCTNKHLQTQQNSPSSWLCIMFALRLKYY